MSDSLYSAVSQVQPIDASFMLAWINKMAEFQKLSQTEIQKNMGSDDYGKVGKDGKITTLYSGSADDLNKHLKGVLKDKGSKLLELQDKYGINAAFMAALVNSESGHGSSKAAKTKNNVAGIMGKDGLRSFDSVEDCLDYLASLLKKNYVNKGVDTISAVQKKYCPVGAENDPTGLNKNWLSSVTTLTNKYENMA
jgi:beta-N-acetylglucosaminidase